jgi:hypothetical protein
MAMHAHACYANGEVAPVLPSAAAAAAATAAVEHYFHWIACAIMTGLTPFAN